MREMVAEGGCVGCGMKPCFQCEPHRYEVVYCDECGTEIEGKIAYTDDGNRELCAECAAEIALNEAIKRNIIKVVVL